jgi:2-succinyl-5-enolpyruvyl-6-hydroxy-3-cyclohexene-1-carboxylate synthase
MISEKPVVQELVALMLAHGVTRAVLCPGSRNSPIVATLAAHTAMECRSVTDERSAGFVALGWAQQAQAPVAVVVTSGSAVLNLHPAVAEAFYRNTPLLVISADRPAAWIGQNDGQTLPQPGVFNNLVRFSAQVPEDDAWHANRLINTALLELSHRNGGPVHLNLPLSEPFFGMIHAELPPVRVIQRTEAARMNADEEEALLEEAAALPRRLILLGQQDAPSPLLAKLAQEKQFAVVGEHIANAPFADSCRPDTLIGASPSADWSPDLLITCGGDVISKRLKRLLRAHPPKAHWHISADGEVIDSFCCLTRVLEGDADEFWDLLDAFAEEGDEAYRARWQTAPTPLPEHEFCGMKFVGELMYNLPEGSVLHLGNSSAVRYAQLFPLPAGVHRVLCNRGVNGIEGSVSTAAGYAMAAPERQHFLIIGDLSMFYDLNGLLQAQQCPNLRILLLNNQEGGIFATLPGMSDCPAIRAPHGESIMAWGGSCSESMQVFNAADWAKALDMLLSDNLKPVLIEAHTKTEYDAAILKEFYKNH